MKRKIDFITASLTGGGAERVLILLAGGLVDKDYKVSIISFGGKDSYVYDTNIRRIPLHGGKIANHTLRRLVNLLKYYKKKSNRPDIIISFLPPISFVAILVARIYKIKIIACEHSNHVQIGSKRDQFTRKYLYRYSSYLTVLTKFDIPYYRNYGINVMVMPNPCSFNTSTNSLSSRNKEILAIGDLNRYYLKGFDNLMVLISPILKLHTEWILKVIGAGVDGKEILSNLAEKYGIADRVIFTGFKSNVQQIMNSSQIFVLSSRFEGLPMVLIEAMSQGMACVAYDCKTGPSDIITHNYNGLLIEDQNMKAMQTGLEMLIENPELRNRLGNNAVKSLERFSIENIIDKWEELITKVL